VPERSASVAPLGPASALTLKLPKPTSLLAAGLVPPPPLVLLSLPLPGRGPLKLLLRRSGGHGCSLGEGPRPPPPLLRTRPLRAWATCG
jgi:hypothetical protein